MPRAAKTVNATEFKAKCLDILDRVGSPDWESVAITKRGRVVAVLAPPAPDEPLTVAALHGALRGTVVIAPGADLTAPAADEPFAAEACLLHQ